MKNSKYTKYIAIALIILFLVTSLISCQTKTDSTNSGGVITGQSHTN